MKLLVTGGLGFIGSNLIRHMLTEYDDIQVTNLDKQNFATWLINNLNQGKEIKVLTDRYVSPTLNTNLAEMLLEIGEKDHRNPTHSRSNQSQQTRIRTKAGRSL